MREFKNLKVIFFPESLLEVHGDGNLVFSGKADTMEIEEGMPWDEKIHNMRDSKRSLTSKERIVKEVAKAFGVDPNQLEWADPTTIGYSNEQNEPKENSDDNNDFFQKAQKEKTP